MILVTGGAGFIGANFVLDSLAQTSEVVINLDALTYAGNCENLASLIGDNRHIFVQVRTQQPSLSKQSLQRSLSARLPSHLRLASTDYELLQ
jgi:dTDP-glucose 4,6-dehydratase